MKKPGPDPRDPDSRDARLKTALKANIARRKAQAAAREAQAGSDRAEDDDAS